MKHFTDAWAVLQARENIGPDTKKFIEEMSKDNIKLRAKVRNQRNQLRHLNKTIELYALRCQKVNDLHSRLWQQYHDVSKQAMLGQQEKHKKSLFFWSKK